jgi:sulfite reductase (NADPH) flavoprotein alpha-component
MQRRLHAVSGIAASLLLVALAVSGALLAPLPALDRAGVSVPPRGAVNLADLAAAVVARYPAAEQITRRPSGRVVVDYALDDEPISVTIDPATAAPIAPYAPSAFGTRLGDFHRAFAMGDAPLGHGLAGLGALALLAVALSGLRLLLTRMGGIALLGAPVRGTPLQKLHVLASRASFLGLVLLALSGAWMSAAFFRILPTGIEAQPAYPAALSGAAPLPLADMAALRAVDLGDLRRLILPYAGDAFEPLELQTRLGAGFIDQASGEVVAWLPHSPARRVYAAVLALHTGQGLWWLALLTGASALVVPVLAYSGLVLWWRRRRARPRIRRNVALGDADTVILVGSEGNSTWGFAYTLQNALTAAGHFVHVAEMNQLAAAHCGDRRMFILTATYGDGAAPATARKFLEILPELKAKPERGVTVLGFGDRDFGHFCYFAVEVEAALIAKGWPIFSHLETINRESPQEFARWGDGIAPHLGHGLRLVHIAETPRRQPFELLSRQDYGAEVGAPSAVMRFGTPPDVRVGLWQKLTGRAALPYFEAGDLIGIVPPGSNMPRYYSIGSASADGFLEFSVREHEHGLCSRYLHGLRAGDRISAFVRPNPEFRLDSGRNPVILVGAGCGVGPLAGFIRANKMRRPMRLYFGARDPVADFLYRREMLEWLAEGKLSALVTAFSRTADPAYLQDKIEADAEVLRAMVKAGAQLMVVGSREMARDVKAAFERVLASEGIATDKLRAEGRYVEDIY